MKTDGSHHLLMLDGHVNDVVGEYRCQADNRLGRGSQVIQVTGQPVVSFGQVHHLGWGRFRISWDTVSQLPITTVRIKYRRIQEDLSNEQFIQWEELLVDTDQSWYEMNHLWSDSVYEVSVSCLNDLGWSKEVTKQFYTDTQTPEELQSLAMELVSSSSTQSSSFFSILSATVLLTLLSKVFQ